MPVDGRLQRVVVGAPGCGENTYLSINVGVVLEASAACAEAKEEIAGTTKTNRSRIYSRRLTSGIQVVSSLEMPGHVTDIADGENRRFRNLIFDSQVVIGRPGYGEVRVVDDFVEADGFKGSEARRCAGRRWSERKWAGVAGVDAARWTYAGKGSYRNRIYGIIGVRKSGRSTKDPRSGCAH